MFHAIDETAMIDISVGPDKDAVLIFRFIIEKLANVDISIDIFHAIAILTIILELSFVKPQQAIFI